MNILGLLKQQLNLFLQRRSENAFYTQMFIKNSYWNSPAPNYEEVLRWEIIEEFVKTISSSKDNSLINILDLGCGRGWLSNLLSLYGHVVGIDPVNKVVQYARFLFPHITFIKGTTTTLLKRGHHKRYDLIVVSEVIEHIADFKKDEFIKDINSLLNQNAYIILTTPRKDAQDEWISYMTPGQPVEDWLTEFEVKDLFKKNNFIAVDLKRFRIAPTNDAPEIEIYQLWLFKRENE